MHEHRWESGESFAIFADGRFCTDYKANWIAHLTMRGWQAEELIDASAPGSTNGDARYVAGGCWVFPTTADAHACTMTGTCVNWASSYPYKNAGTSASNFYNNAWLDAAHGAEHGLDDALHQTVTLYYGHDGVAADEPGIVDMTCSGEEGSGCCGAMSWGSCTQIGASVAVYQSQGGLGCVENGAPGTIAHEMGHNLGLLHDATYPFNFMHDTGQYLNADLNASNTAQAAIGLEAAECGRRPGFEWIGAGNTCGACPP